MQAEKSTARPTGLQVDLARRIANDIISHIHAAGTHLSEESLARRYQVSRTPVRAALKLLAAEHFIESRPNSGYYVGEIPDGIAPPCLRASGMTADEVYTRLIEDRADLKIPDHFNERDLQQRYGVTRSVLAKTLVRLSAEALIEKRQGHGWRFTYSLMELEAREESYRFRAAVECGALLEPTFRTDPAALRRLRAAHEALLRDSAQAEIPPEVFFNLNADFHETLGRFSGNRFFLQAIQQQNQLRRLESRSAFVRNSPRFRPSVEEHLAIIGALEDEDREWAVAIMRRHLLRVMRVA
ncbi:GntR family transcriptional regulator [Bordetella bronchialis]|uniref:GntR family transcriptional regulator n=1 Tax=Bordetella bronchialis TaxID=463025 RepID=A0A193FG69_9BORD|nr:GntR family transcriptional regulator [Bordetella bronchialis]ANN66253.1 GntR family transcriptional regulator [Bordetella bronchialis]ANN71334.1 GntR family transcriptional regulator [Bordetella bronchialis]